MKTIYLIGLLLMGFVMPSFAQKTYDLKLNPANGSKYNVSGEANVAIKQSMMGQDMEIKMKYAENASYEMNKAGDDVSIKLTYTSVKVHMDMMGNAIDLDSESPDTTNDGNKYIRALKGSSLLITVTPKGEVKKIEGLDALSAKLENSVDPSKREQVKQMVGSFISEESIKSRIENSLKIYPSKPVKIGDTWTASTTMLKPYKTVTNNTFTLASVNGATAKITSTGTISTDGDQKMETNGMEMTVNLAGEQKGNADVEVATGILNNSESAQNIKGKMSVMGQEVPMEVTSVYKSSFTK